jgi:hypothetical protein
VSKLLIETKRETPKTQKIINTSYASVLSRSLFVHRTFKQLTAANAPACVSKSKKKRIINPNSTLCSLLHFIFAREHEHKTRPHEKKVTRKSCKRPHHRHRSRARVFDSFLRNSERRLRRPTRDVFNITIVVIGGER